ncbi:transposase, partial [Porphyromonas sp.]
VGTKGLRNRGKHLFFGKVGVGVDGGGVRTLLNKKYTKTQNATGNPVYDALMMFKILLLQTWYSLSDYEVEEM